MYLFSCLILKNIFDTLICIWYLRKNILSGDPASLRRNSTVKKLMQTACKRFYSFLCNFELTSWWRKWLKWAEVAFEPQQVQVLDYLRARSCCPSPLKKGHHNFITTPGKKSLIFTCTSIKLSLNIPPWRGRCWCTYRQVISAQCLH